MDKASPTSNNSVPLRHV